ncbi:protoglobin domain-containing protein [Streptomyces sp. NPDC004059]
MPDPAGYTYGTDEVARSPVSLAELDELRGTVGLTEEDEHYLRLAAEVLSPQAEAMVDAWRALIAGHPHLAAYSAHPDGRPDPRYSAASKPRFVQWITDVCTRPYDRNWLGYQHEIGLRHEVERMYAAWTKAVLLHVTLWARAYTGPDDW